MHQPSCAPAPRPAGPAPPACTSRPARRRLALPGLPRGDLRRPDDRSLNPPPPPVRAVASRFQYSSALLRRAAQTPHRTPGARRDPLARATPAPQNPLACGPWRCRGKGPRPIHRHTGQGPGPAGAGLTRGPCPSSWRRPGPAPPQPPQPRSWGGGWVRLRPPPTDPTGEESEPASQRDGEGDRKRRGRGGRRVRGGRGETGRGRGREAGERGRGRLGGESGTGRQGEQEGRGRGEGRRERRGGDGGGVNSARSLRCSLFGSLSAQQRPSKGKCLRRIRPAPASGPPAPAPCAPAGLATPPAASAPFAARNRRGQRRGTGKGMGGWGGRGVLILAGSAAGPAGPAGPTG